MAVTRAQVLHVGRLARLELSSAEIERFTEQLNGILAHVEELAEAVAGDGSAARAADTAGTAPGAPLRPDRPGPDPLRRAPAALAAAWEDGFFVLPRLPALDADVDRTEP